MAKDKDKDKNKEQPKQMKAKKEAPKVRPAHERMPDEVIENPAWCNYNGAVMSPIDFQTLNGPRTCTRAFLHKFNEEKAKKEKEKAEANK